MKSGIYTVSHGAHIYYEREGKGRPIVLIHGWGCSGRFYKKNVEGLKDRYEVITMDMRGHGRSSKMLDGYSIDRMAKDIHEVIEYLGLKDVLLMGWSMGGPTMLSYWKQFGKDRGHLAGLGLIDMTPFPFSPGEWNSPCGTLEAIQVPCSMLRGKIPLLEERTMVGTVIVPRTSV